MKAVDLLYDKSIKGKELRTPVKVGTRRGAGIIEASRGTLIRDDETDEKGMITRAIRSPRNYIRKLIH